MAESSLGYKLRVLRKASFGKFFDVVKTASERSGKSKAYCMTDMLGCMRKYGAGYYDYIIFQFYNLTPAQRDTYLTRFRSKKLIMQYNDESYAHIFDNKNEFNHVFKDYIGRKFVDMESNTDEEIIDYISNTKRIFAKMKDLTCGHGAEIIDTSEFENSEAVLRYAREKNFGTLEDIIENHPALAEMYPCSVNTMRMITLIGDDGKPHLIYAVQKFGNNGRIVDNYGLHGPVDLET